MTALHAGQGGAAQAAQAAAWQRYLAWERSNVQHLDGPALAARVVLAYDQALGPLVHFPEARVPHRLRFRFRAPPAQGRVTCSDARQSLLDSCHRGLCMPNWSPCLLYLLNTSWHGV